MLDAFDSRALRLADCYGQRFMEVGVYEYSILPAHWHCPREKHPFVVKVTERKGAMKMNSHAVVVGSSTTDGFTVDQREILIEAGDLVLWNCPDSKALPYMVVGAKEFFSSDRLLNESGYSHAFGAPGEYCWADAHGSAISGVVRVKDPGCKDRAGFQRWYESLAKGTLVMISEQGAKPSEVEIVTGQTVFFSIVKSPGISITDRRLLAHADIPKPQAKGQRAVARHGR